MDLIKKYKAKNSSSAFKHKTMSLLIGLMLFADIADAQTIKVSGQITDSGTQESIPGVSIAVKGTTLGTISDLNGIFNIEADQKDSLILSSIGYQTQTVGINGQTSLNISMVASDIAIDDVIVIAYGTTTKSNLTGSAVALSNEELKDVFSPSVSGLLEGKVAGLYTKSSSGRPGSSPTINIRGKGSLSNTTAPLWVVDGIIMGNTDPGLSPADVESITVLKDASATSLYGSLAANGVILVQTKRPQNGVSKISVSATRGATVLSTGNFSLMNSQELYDYHEGWNTNPWFTEELLNTNTDWFDIGTQHGVAQEYNINYTGGTDKISTYISGTYYNETGAIKGFDYERFSGIANIEVRANERLTFKANLSGDYRNTFNQEHSLYNMYTYMPWDNPYLPDGTPLHPVLHAEYLNSINSEWIGRDQSNYLYDLQYNYSSSRGNNLRANIGFDFKINDWLTFTSMNNIALGFSNNESYTDPRSYSGLADRGTIYSGYGFDQKRFTNQLLRFNKSFGESHVTAFAAWEYSDTHIDNNDATGKGVAAGLNVLNTTAEAQDVSGYKFETAKQSILFNVMYSYNDRYMATASFSRQGSSSFGPNNQYGNFWSASAGWNMHNESFMKGIEWLNVLKLTASMGQVGNAPGGFQYLGYYELTGQYNGLTAARPYQKGNPDISWEKVTSYNLALNTRLFNRVGINLDLYKRDSDGQLAYVPLPAMTGYSGVWMNVGRVVNSGYELAITPEILKSQNFGWEMTINVAYNKNEVLELYEDKAYTSGSKRIEVGYDMDSWYQRIWYGVDPGTGLPLYEQEIEDADGNISKELVNSHAEATLQHTDKKGTPSYIGGIINQVRVYDFTLSANLSFVQGIYLYHSDRELFDSDGSYATFNHMNLASGWSRWEKPGDIATHPKPQNGGVDANKNSTRYLEDASYLRLRNVTLSYQLPKRILNYAKISGASVYLSGDNLLTFTKWSGVDPETGTMYPVVKKFLAGIKIDF
ncbi:MAG: SusC/RagA family TonB-linked outer membrane protein [Bacteroidales bacterium]|nr:SusC/RagA family TonB-linked outer membrane protein [Bacteroidales bacterium]